jgi:hypothetical protein
VPKPQMVSALSRLAERRPFFYSEADFQHALAWELHVIDPRCDVHLEKQVAGSGHRVHLDLLVCGRGYEYAIELKYKTRRVALTHRRESCVLRNQSAQDIGRHDFLKDIERLERYVAVRRGAEGYAILLTNDRTYWSASRKLNAVDLEFRVHEGRELRGNASWGAAASAGTKHKREAAIQLRGHYKIAWRDYFSFGSMPGESFRYALVQI